jgi:hypothetical protein
MSDGIAVVDHVSDAIRVVGIEPQLRQQTLDGNGAEGDRRQLRRRTLKLGDGAAERMAREGDASVGNARVSQITQELIRIHQLKSGHLAQEEQVKALTEISRVVQLGAARRDHVVPGRVVLEDRTVVSAGRTCELERGAVWTADRTPSRRQLALRTSISEVHGPAERSIFL